MACSRVKRSEVFGKCFLMDYSSKEIMFHVRSLYKVAKGNSAQNVNLVVKAVMIFIYPML